MNAVRAQPLSKLGEFGWLKTLLPTLHWPIPLRSHLLLGAGDDAGVLKLTPGHVLVATTDGMAEGVHFYRKWNRWEALGHKILAVNLSDLAAMGDVRPLAALVTASIPGDTSVDTVDKFARGLNSCAQRWITGILGGDTIGSKSGWFLSVTVLGEAKASRLVRRSGAQVGDWLACTGPLGLASAGLEVLEKGCEKVSWARPLLNAFLKPEPRFAAGSLLGRHQWATSLLDCSDGLSASVQLLAAASHVGFTVDLAKIPRHPALTRWSHDRRKPISEYVLEGGEDYELIFTCRPARWKQIQRALPAARVIGEALPAQAGCWATDEFMRRPIKSYGYAHFRQK